jgi:hypothetical protein
VVEKCRAAAEKYGYASLRFIQGDIQAHTEPADMLVSLHACDTATDYALRYAVGCGAKYIFAAPCCQHELNGKMQTKGTPLSLLSRYGVVKERAAALVTDAVRANVLAACGYKTQLMEFVDLTHTPKNLLIRAVKTYMPERDRATYRREAEALCEAFGCTPIILKLLRDDTCGI